MRTPLISVVLLAAACGSTPDAAHAVYTVVSDPRTDEVDRRIRLLEDNDREMRRNLAKTLLNELHVRAEGRETKLARLYSLSPDVLLDLPPGLIAALAPEELRVYDLGAVLDTGPDTPETLMGPGDGDPGGKGGRLKRLAGLLRDLVGSERWPADRSFIAAEGEHLVVLHDPGAFGDIEEVLDRIASVGGPTVRVGVSVRRPRDAGNDWQSVDAVPDSASDPAGTLIFDVPWGRQVGARRTVSRAYLKDYDVHSGTLLGDPSIGVVDTGLAVTVTSSTETGTPVLDVRLQWAEGPDRIEVFSTQLGMQLTPVQLEIPQLHRWEWRRRIDPGVERALVLGDADDPAALIWLAGDVEPATPRPAWRRVSPAHKWIGEAADGELLDNAYELASAYLDAKRPEDAARALESALRASKLNDFTRRLRLGEGRSPTVVLLRRVEGAPDDLEDLLANAGVVVGPAHGFLTVEDGVLAAALDPEDKGALDRALGAIRRGADRAVDVDFMGGRAEPGGADVAAGALRITDGEFPPGCLGMRRRVVPGLPAAWQVIEQMSFIQDFDVEVAQGAAIADPIIGILQEGVTMEVVAAASGAATSLDVRVMHVRVGRPIRTFSTSLGAAQEVTIQLPELEVTVLPARVLVRPGERADLGALFGEEAWRFRLYAGGG